MLYGILTATVEGASGKRVVGLSDPSCSFSPRAHLPGDHTWHRIASNRDEGNQRHAVPQSQLCRHRGGRLVAKRKLAESDEVRKEESSVHYFEFLRNSRVFLLVRRLRNDSLGWQRQSRIQMETKHIYILWLLIRGSNEANFMDLIPR